MPETAISSLSFAQARAQLEAGAVAILSAVPEANRNVLLPTVELRRGKTQVTLAFKQLAAEDFFSLLIIFEPYFKELRRLRKGWGSASYFEADIYSESARRTAEEKKEPLPVPLSIDFKWEPRKEGGAIIFERDGFLLQQELNAILEVVKKLGTRNSVSARSPEEALTQIGAVLFHASPDFGEDRIAGYEQVKREVRETIVMPLLHEELFNAVTNLARTRQGSSVPRAVLFEGPPGTGKTTMARVMASESKLPLVYVPIESIMSKWVGESEKRLGTVFELASTFGKSIVFLDEIDAFAGSREKGNMPEYVRRLLSVLLRQMQGLVDTSGTVIIGATNRKVDLDPALLNRFTRSIFFPLPNPDERAAIIGYYAKHLSEAERLTLAERCDGRSGREIEDACGTAERTWATQLVTGGAASASPPPLDQYASAFRLKFMGR